jgi:thiol:disulfide interchange protein
MHNHPMVDRTRRRLLMLVALGCVPASALAARETHPLPPDFDPARDPAHDLETALRIARAARRNVLVEVGGDWSAPCRAFSRFVASNDDLRKVLDKNYVWLKVNFSKENENAAFLRRFPAVNGYPHFFVLDAAGKLLHSQGGEAFQTNDDFDPAALRAFFVKWAPQK